MVLGGFSLAVAAVWVVLAFSLSGVAARVLLTVVFVALAGLACYWSRACVVVRNWRVGGLSCR